MKVPVSLCGAGCVVEEGEEECHEKEEDRVQQVGEEEGHKREKDRMLQVPEEQCDLQPREVCKKATKLVPSLSPEQECTLVPREVGPALILILCLLINLSLFLLLLKCLTDQKNITNCVTKFF